MEMLADLVLRLQKIGGDGEHVEEEIDTTTSAEEETDYWQEEEKETKCCAALLTRTLAWLFFLCATVFITYAYFNLVFSKKRK